MRITFGREFARLITFLGMLLISAATTAFAQFDSATVLGTVRDSNGAALPSATVTLKNIATGISVTTQSDTGGDFQFPNVRIGNYRVSAELQGFSTRTSWSLSTPASALI